VILDLSDEETRGLLNLLVETIEGGPPARRVCDT
jgi:hypothetical protein